MPDAVKECGSNFADVESKNEMARIEDKDFMVSIMHTQDLCSWSVDHLSGRILELRVQSFVCPLDALIEAHLHRTQYIPQSSHRINKIINKNLMDVDSGVNSRDSVSEKRVQLVSGQSPSVSVACCRLNGCLEGLVQALASDVDLLTHPDFVLE